MTERFPGRQKMMAWTRVVAVEEVRSWMYFKVEPKDLLMSWMKTKRKREVKDGYKTLSLRKRCGLETTENKSLRE